jgi:hypothetical protein
VHLARQAACCCLLSTSFPPLTGESDIFLLYNREAGVLSWSGPFALGKQVFWHPQNDILPLSGEAGFLLFDGVAEILPWEGLVVNAGPQCSVGREASWHQQNRKAYSLSFTCLCGGRLLALSSKLRCLWGSKASRLKLSGACKAAEALGSTCAEAQAPRSQSNCCSHGKINPVGSGSSGACLLGTCWAQTSSSPVQ